MTDEPDTQKPEGESNTCSAAELGEKLEDLKTRATALMARMAPPADIMQAEARAAPPKPPRNPPTSAKAAMRLLGRVLEQSEKAIDKLTGDTEDSYYPDTRSKAGSTLARIAQSIARVALAMEKIETGARPAAATRGARVKAQPTDEGAGDEA
jgi:hypothetical protein